MAAYTERWPLYGSFGETAKSLIRAVLGQEQLQVHDVTFRVKSAPSLKQKIERPDKQYRVLEDVTDLLGIRITTLFVNGIDRVAAVLPKIFDIDSTRSVDKREMNSSERFGYQSLHMIATLNQNRRELLEHRDIAGLYCEIQIRSILQHAWAEIEHDLGYKARHGGPPDVRRRFSKLSALLELADDEFLRLRADVERATATDDVEASPETTRVTPVTLGVLLASDPVATRLLEELTAVFNTSPSELDTSTLDDRVEELQQLGLDTVDRLRDALQSQSRVIPSFAKRFFGRTYGANWTSSFLLFLLVQIFAAQQPASEGEAVRKFEKLNIASPPERRHYVRQIRAFLNAFGTQTEEIR